MTTFLFHGDTVRHPAIRHEVGLEIIDPFLLIVRDGATLVLTNSLERSRLRWGLKALVMPPSALVHAPHALRHAGLPAGERLAAAGMLLRLRTARAGWMLRQALTGRP